MPGFRVFSMMNNKLAYLLVQMLFKLHHPVHSLFFPPIIHTWCIWILWCCGFSSDLLDAPCCGSLFCLSLSVSKFAAGSVSDKCYWALFVSTRCLCKAIPSSCDLCPLLNCLCSSMVKFIPHVFWWPIIRGPLSRSVYRLLPFFCFVPLPHPLLLFLSAG